MPGHDGESLDTFAPQPPHIALIPRFPADTVPRAFKTPSRDLT